MKRILLCCLLWPIELPAFAEPVHAPWPGGVAVVPIDSELPPRAYLGDNPVMVLRRSEGWAAIVGVPLEHAADAPLDITIMRPGLPVETVSIELEAADYRVQRLNVDRKYVDPGQEALDRIFRERDIIDAALTNWRTTTVDDISLRAPVPGTRSSSFGSRRIFNDQPRSPHKGMDIAATTGTPISAPLPGIISTTGDFYFNGNTVIVDHGQGLISLYCHLSEIDVADGDSVRTGDLLGKVGGDRPGDRATPALCHLPERHCRRSGTLADRLKFGVEPLIRDIGSTPIWKLRQKTG